jgi:Zn-finger nucleic acid-binding protein
MRISLKEGNLFMPQKDRHGSENDGIMKCADCQTALKRSRFKGITIDTCPQCKGRWFDRDELKKAKDNTDEDLRWLNFDPFTKAADSLKVKSEQKQCPKCRTPMASLHYDKSDVIINRCDTCQGIWIHHGEFEKIIRYLERTVSQLSASEIAVDSVKHLIETITHPDDHPTGVKDFLVVFKLLNLKISVEHPQLTDAVNKIYKYLPFI